jgi:hypothetical protein
MGRFDVRLLHGSGSTLKINVRMVESVVVTSRLYYQEGKGGSGERAPGCIVSASELYGGDCL